MFFFFVYKWFNFSVTFVLQTLFLHSIFQCLSVTTSFSRDTLVIILFSKSKELSFMRRRGEAAHEKVMEQEEWRVNRAEQGFRKAVLCSLCCGAVWKGFSFSGDSLQPFL